MPVRELAPAKINLTLSVLGRRADGYHELESLVTFADVHDVVTLEPGAASSVVVAGPFAGIYRRREPSRPGAHAAAGCGPGSFAWARSASTRICPSQPASAAARPTRQRCSAPSSMPIRSARRTSPWLDIAARLGADVPVCLGARPALMWGIGERTEPLRRLPQAHAVLVNPGLPLSTADVFRALGRRTGTAGASGADAPRPCAVERPDRLYARARQRPGTPGDPSAARHRRDQGRAGSRARMPSGCDGGKRAHVLRHFADRPQQPQPRARRQAVCLPACTSSAELGGCQSRIDCLQRTAPAR